MTTLTDTERDSLTECECVHFANEHNGQGCTATVDEDAGTWQESYGDYICDCLNTPDTISNDAIETLLADRVQAATLAERERLLGVIEVLASDWGQSSEWATKRGYPPQDDALTWAQEHHARKVRTLIAQERAR